MTRQPTFNYLLEEWLDDGPEVAPHGLLESVLVAVPNRTQHRPGVMRRLPMLSTTVQRAAAIAAVAVVAIAGLIFAARGNPSIGVSPTASASPSGTASSAVASMPAVASSSAVAAACAPSTPEPGPTATSRIPGALMLHYSAVLGGGTTYTTTFFTPAFSFAGQACWNFGGDDVGAARVSDNGTGLIMILRPSAVIDPNGIARAVPADLVAWLRSDTDLSLAKPTTFTVGGLEATLFSGTVRPTAGLNGGGDYNLACGNTIPSSCVADANNGGIDAVGFGGNQPFELIVLPVRGQTLLIGLTASAADWPTARPQLEAFIAGMTFPAAS
jgi:hypothetical protein